MSATSHDQVSRGDADVFSSRAPTATPGDRRQDRCNVPEEALARYMEALAERCALAALVLVDGNGHVVATSEGGRELERLSEIADATAHGADYETVIDAIESLAGADEVYAPVFTADGARFCLISIGGCVPDVHEVAQAVERIRGAMHS
jgi:hypothetical protein